MIPEGVFIVAPETKFVPVSVTGTLLPADPAFGEMLLRVGAAGVTENVLVFEVPPLLVTLTL